MNAIDVQHFLRRAKDFESSMKLCTASSTSAEVVFLDTGQAKTDETMQSAALLGIHAAISYADALRIGLGDSELLSEDHQDAVRRLKDVLADKRLKDMSGIGRFGELLSKKGSVAYRKNRISGNDLKQIVESSQRFSSWVNTIGKELKVEGWGNVDTEA